jgi:riboflavin kinase / FMN adenylyltransferase
MTALVARSVSEARNRFGACALAIGNFDGVHIGHQVLLQRTVDYSIKHNLLSAALTFHPHPTAVVAPERQPEMIVSLDERIRLIESCGVERIFVLPFTMEVSRMTPGEFVSQILVDTLSSKAVVVGETFHFGAKQAGTAETLRSLGDRMGFVSQFLAPVSYRGEIVSSSAIRQHLEAGNVGRANRLLGRCFALSGPVVPGHGVGSKQTVPTLNLKHTPGQVLPRGVFVTETCDEDTGRCWHSITNVGNRPTFAGDEITIETYLLSPLEGAAPVRIRVKFHRFVRSERHFPDAAALKSQILADVRRAQAFWRRASKLRQASASVY